MANHGKTFSPAFRTDKSHTFGSFDSHWRKDDSHWGKDGFKIGHGWADSASLKWLFLLTPIHELIVGTQNDDTLAAKAEGDVVLGLGGNDALSSAFNRTALLGGTDDDTLETDVLVALQGTDPVHGLAIQMGGAGNDSLDATVTLQGGDVTVAERNLTADIWLDGGSGNDVINAVANVSSPVFASVTIKNHILGGSGDDVINALADARNALDNQTIMNKVDGGSGNDNITAAAETEFDGFGSTVLNILNGGSGNDVLDASAKGQSNATDLVSNSLSGGRGDDVLRAFNLTDSNSQDPVGINKLWGGDGDDSLEATHSTDGGNTITNVTNLLDGGRGDDILKVDSKAFGGFVEAVNRLKGGNGDDKLTANLDADAHNGIKPSGFDGPLYDVSNVLKGGCGDDTLDAVLALRADIFAPDDSRAENILDGGSGNDVLTATVTPDSPGTSLLYGGRGDDQLTVFGGIDNVLRGGSGKDTLTGGTGDDFMFGGSGADALVFAQNNGHDTVSFQTGKDKMDLTALAVIGINDFADLIIEVLNGDSIVHFDANNDITVTGVTNLAASDFLFA